MNIPAECSSAAFENLSLSAWRGVLCLLVYTDFSKAITDIN